MKRMPRFSVRFKSGLQLHHTWGALLWRKTGISFRSVDRAFVTLLLLFTLLTMSAMFHGRGQTYVGRGLVVFYSALAGIVPGFIWSYLFTHTGEMGYKQKWFELNNFTPLSSWRCLRYRFPERCRWVWYALILICVSAMIWYILSIALMFDQNPEYFCIGQTTASWLTDFIIQYVFTIALIEPLKVLGLTTVQGFSKTKPINAGDIDEETSKSDNLEMGEYRSTSEADLPTIPFDDIEVTKMLGEGAFGMVHQCIWHGIDCAIKQLKDPKAEAEFLHEVSINRHLILHKHQCVVGFLGITENPRGLLMELYPLQSVEDYVIRGGNVQAPEDLCNVLKILINASAGVLHLHANGVVHRDIAARNFLIRHDLTTAVCDMGLALLLDKGLATGQRTLEQRTGDRLPVNTTAPETLASGEYSPKSDVYMFGIFIWELLARQVPYGDDRDLCGTNRNVASFFARLLGGLQLRLNNDWPEPLRDLMYKCWALNPASRPSMKVVNETLRQFNKVALDHKIALPSPLPQCHQLTGDDMYDLVEDIYSNYSPMTSVPFPNQGTDAQNNFQASDHISVSSTSSRALESKAPSSEATHPTSKEMEVNLSAAGMVRKLSIDSMEFDSPKRTQGPQYGTYIPL